MIWVSLARFIERIFKKGVENKMIKSIDINSNNGDHNSSASIERNIYFGVGDHSLQTYADRRVTDRRKWGRRAIDKLGMNKLYTKTITVVMPALNEEKAIGDVIKEIPIDELNKINYGVEIMVIDNGSKDKTTYIATNHGARVIIQPIKGYGNAYKAGFANASGDIVATGDADLTYPFVDLPKIIQKMESENLDFITTDRLSNLQPGIMTRTHYFGNLVPQSITKVLFSLPFNDSQSGMWVFKRSIWPKLNVKSSGMPFSQELKIEAYRKGFKCAEVPIAYRARVGERVLA